VPQNRCKRRSATATRGESPRFLPFARQIETAGLAGEARTGLLPGRKALFLPTAAADAKPAIIGHPAAEIPAGFLESIPAIREESAGIARERHDTRYGITPEHLINYTSTFPGAASFASASNRTGMARTSRPALLQGPCPSRPHRMSHVSRVEAEWLRRVQIRLAASAAARSPRRLALHCDERRDFVRALPSREPPDSSGSDGIAGEPIGSA